MTTLRCSACGSEKFLRPYSPWHSAPICKPCFMVWYDPPTDIDTTNPDEVGKMSLKLKAAKKWPWTGEFAEAPAEPAGGLS